MDIFPIWPHWPTIAQVLNSESFWRRSFNHNYEYDESICLLCCNQSSFALFILGFRWFLFIEIVIIRLLLCSFSSLNIIYIIFVIEVNKVILVGLIINLIFYIFLSKLYKFIEVLLFNHFLICWGFHKSSLSTIQIFLFQKSGCWIFSPVSSLEYFLFEEMFIRLMIVLVIFCKDLLLYSVRRKNCKIYVKTCDCNANQVNHFVLWLTIDTNLQIKNECAYGKD